MGAFEFAAVPATLKITPQAINLKSRGKAPRVQLVFPHGIGLEDIDTDQPVMLMSAEFVFTAEKIAFSSKKGKVTLDISIDRGVLGEHFNADGQTTLSVTGLLIDGRTFYATNTIRIISK